MASSEPFLASVDSAAEKGLQSVPLNFFREVSSQSSTSDTGRVKAEARQPLRNHVRTFSGPPGVGHEPGLGHDDAILGLAFGERRMCPSRLSRRLSACRLLNRGPICALHGQRRRANVERINRNLSLFLADSYHFVLDLPWRRFLLLFCLVYNLSFVGFAVIYKAACKHCELGCESFYDALFLSVETMTTVGFGVPDPYFKSCPWLVTVIITQCMLGTFLDSTLVGIVYQKISAGGRRSATILFSDKAVIQTVGGANYFMFQVCEMRRLQLVECQVRCYLFTRPFGVTPEEAAAEEDVGVEMRPMRLEQPDDALGAMLLLVLPTAVVHRIDEWSPLRGESPVPANSGSRRLSVAQDSPRAPWSSLPAVPGSPAPGARLAAPASPGGGANARLGAPRTLVPPQRASEADAGVRNAVWCEACGECFQRVEQLRRHVAYLTRPGAGDDPAHAALLERLPKEASAQEVRQQVQSYLRTHFAEVVCLIDGIDPLTSSNVQARHSYVATDIVWDSRFANCVRDTALPSGGPGILIDFGCFHDLEPLEG